MDKKLRTRCWIDIGGKKFFGPGRAQLLAHIEEQGSLAKAAAAMGMSYKKAWSMVDDMNRRGKQPYVILFKGGSTGGGAELSETGKAVLKAFYEMMDSMNRTIENHQSEVLKLI